MDGSDFIEKGYFLGLTNKYSQNTHLCTAAGLAFLHLGQPLCGILRTLISKLVGFILPHP